MSGINFVLTPTHLAWSWEGGREVWEGILEQCAS